MNAPPKLVRDLITMAIELAWVFDDSGDAGLHADVVAQHLDFITDVLRDQSEQDRKTILSVVDGLRAKGCPVMPFGSVNGVWCGASQGGGASAYWRYVDVSPTRRGAVPGGGHPEECCGTAFRADDPRTGEWLGRFPENANLVSSDDGIGADAGVPST